MHLVTEQFGAELVAPAVLRLALPTPTLPPATTTNHYILGAPDAVLVDPAAPAFRDQAILLRLINQLRDDHGVHVRQLLLTHHHGDHVGAAVALAERLNLPIAAHRLTAQRLQGIVPVDVLIEDGQKIAEDPDGCWQALHTPGHAPGHLILHHAEHALVIAGDLVAGQGTIAIDPTDGDMGQYLESLQRVHVLSPKRIAPAHGPVLDDATGVLSFYMAHRRARESKVLQSLSQQWQPADALLPMAYADVSRLQWPFALRSLQSHLLHLAQLGLAQTQDGRWRRAPES